jgi:TetR/AcrR family transcriptional repressor of nem operon
MTRRRNVEARELILGTAYELFSSEGYEAVSVERVAQAAGLKKSIVFYYYPSKQALGAAVIEAAAEQHAAGMRALFSDDSRDPVETVGSLFEYGVRGKKRDCGQGCFIGKMGQELNDRDAQMRRRIRMCMGQWRENVAAYLDIWRHRGYFRSGFKPMEAADGILSLYEGSMLIARIVGGEDPIDHARSAAMTVVVSWKG